MKKARSALAFVTLMCIVIGIVVNSKPAYASPQSSLRQTIDTYVHNQWSASKIPGLAISVTQNGQAVYNEDLGYADLDVRRSVTSSTLFELGSDSKAFTALAILQLEQQGLLSAQASVARYLPWFWVTYKGQKVAITVDELMHHTSGIGAKTIGNIPISSANNALETTVRTLVGLKLSHQPGQVFEYATINYDVLGLLIEQVTRETYARYLREHILTPLGLTHTYVGRDGVDQAGIATGYKIFLGSPHRYSAPDYRGNIPAGYILSNQEDMIRWTQIQLGLISISPAFDQLIQQSHIPDRSVPPDTDGSSYAAGWSVFQIDGGIISHDGSNPNFSSYIAFLPRQKVGIVLLTNMDSNYTDALGQGIGDLFLGRELPKSTQDLYMQLDKVASFLLFLGALAILALLFFMASDIFQIIQHKRRFVALSGKKLLELLLSLVLLGLFAVALYDVPTLAFQGLPWDFVTVWGPESILAAVWVIALAGGLIYVYYLLSTLTWGEKEQPYYWLTVFGVISGIGNAFIIFVINETFVNKDNLTNGLLFYFIIGIVTYVFGQRFVRYKIIELTSNILFARRVELLRALQATSYRDFETLERGSILAGLNNDTEMISNSVNTTITGLTNIVTLVCCLAYLGFMNGFGLLIAVGVIGGTTGFYFLVGQRAEKHWEKMRDSQSHFFQLIDDLLNGFKELQLNYNRRTSFQTDIEQVCQVYKERRTEGEYSFANVFVVGELLFVIVIGCVVFLYPYILPDIGQDVLHNYVFVFLYMTGPVNAVLEAYPQIIRMRISWKRINELAQMLAKTRTRRDEQEAPQLLPAPLRVEVEHLQFTYVEKDGKTFTLGPIDCTFTSGEISFITGGNGSGKSTLAKLLTGLYTPDSGSVRINGEIVAPEHLSEYFSSIFSDFYLFEKLYGIDLERKEQAIQDYMELLRLADKVQVQNGKFSTTRLSSGQRKRLALLVSYLEDRPICVYDEWASDQDPEYRAFFYNEMLPMLRDRGKCLIIITHDDRYFGIANQILKLEMGKMAPLFIESR
jgi:putative ATP-binding cassette transporter